MLSFDDARWETLKAGYRVPIDLRPLLNRLESSATPESAWEEIWQELYHQGDVDEGTFAAIPHLVRIHRARGAIDWNTYSIAAFVELGRGVDGNPDVPEWARDSYTAALRELADLGLAEIPRTRDLQAIRSILGLVAIVFGARTHGRVLSEFDEDEMKNLIRAAFGEDEENDA